MNIAKKMVDNASMFFLSYILSYILTFISFIYSANYLGARDFGALSFAIAFTGVISIFTDLGINQLTVRDVSRNKTLTSKYLLNAMLIKFLLGLFTFSLIILIAITMGYREQALNLIILIGFSTIVLLFSKNVYSIFQAHEKMAYESLGNILYSALMLLATFYAIYIEANVITFASIYASNSLIILSYAACIYIWKFGLPSIDVDFQLWGTIIKNSLPFGLSILFLTVYYWIDSVMLSMMINDEVVGWYNVAYKFIVVLLFIPAVLNTVIFPVMSKYYTISVKTFIQLFSKYFEYMAIISFPIGLGITLLADRIILLIFNMEYINSAAALKILVWSSVFIYLSAPFGRLFEASNKQMIVTKITGICAAENIILNYLLIPNYSYLGASAATVFTEFTALIIMLYASSKMPGINIKNSLLIIVKPIFASLLMGVFLLLLIDYNLILLIISASIFYFTILYSLKTFEEKDIKLFKNLIRSDSNNIEKKVEDYELYM